VQLPCCYYTLYKRITITEVAYFSNIHYYSVASHVTSSFVRHITIITIIIILTKVAYFSKVRYCSVFPHLTSSLVRHIIITLTKVAYFSKTYYPSVAPTSHVCSSAMLLLLFVGNYKTRVWGDFQWHNIHNKCESRSIISKDERKKTRTAFPEKGNWNKKAKPRHHVTRF
jgi:hypothetical protein